MSIFPKFIHNVADDVVLYNGARYVREKPPEPKGDLADELVFVPPEEPDTVHILASKSATIPIESPIGGSGHLAAELRRCIRHAVRESVARARETTFAYGSHDALDGMDAAFKAVLKQVNKEKP